MKANYPPLNTLISLNGKRALITGSGAGIGSAMAYRFAEAGANLELVDINEQALRVLKENLGTFNVEINAYKADLSNKKDIDTLWEKLSGKEPDILVNNAGIYPTNPFLELDESFLRKTMSINLESVFWMCQRMIKRRLKKGGVIINVGSIEAVMPFKEELCHYDISKAGVMVLTRALAHEYGKNGFRINALVPGGIWAQGTKSLAKDVIRFKVGVAKSGVEYRLRNPLGRLGLPDEVARMAVVLASDLSSYVHGTLIVVDGGFLSA